MYQRRNLKSKKYGDKKSDLKRWVSNMTKNTKWQINTAKKGNKICSNLLLME